jgi:hypothetical protein
MKRIVADKKRGPLWLCSAGPLAAIGVALATSTSLQAQTTAPSFDPAPSALGSTAVQVLTILAALVMILLVQIVALILVFRRYAGQLVPQVRVEVVQNPSEGGNAEVLVHRVQLASAVAESRRRGAGKPSDDVPELPPDYAEEVRSQMDAKQRQDEAVLRQIVADNLRMRKQMDEFEE